MDLVAISADRGMPNCAKTEREEAKQKGEEGEGMHVV